MTQKDKELLFKDLCARLPYGVKVQHQHHDYLDEIQTIEHITRKYAQIETESVLGFVDDFKPYLRPMSSMTEEEKEEYQSIQSDIWKPCGTQYYDNWRSIDWLNEHHFDYRNLIGKNLALDCTGLHIYD